MALALLSAAVLFGAAAEAVQFKAARATQLPEIPADAMSPRPTSPPELRRMLRRDTATTVYYAQDNTCGFLSGSEDNAYTCNDIGAQCAIITLSNKSGYIGCCDDGDCGGFHLTCVDSAGFYSSSLCDDSCEEDTFTLKCTDSEVPYCNSVSINGGNTLKVYGYYCNEEAISTVQAILTTYNGETDGRSFSASVLTSDIESTADETETFGGGAGTSSTSSSSSTTTTSTTPVGGGSGSSSTPTPTPTPTPKKSNAGAIAGGVVGGVAGLGLIVLAVLLLLRRQRKDVAVQQPGQGGAPVAPPQDPAPGGVPPVFAAPGMAQVNSSPPPPSVGSGPYYDPSKTPEYAYAAGGSPPLNQPPYFQGQPQPYPPQQQQQPYYAAAAVPGGPSPDRTDSTSPLPAGSVQQQQSDFRMSGVSAVGSSSGPYGSSPYQGSISPQNTGNTGAASSGLGVIPGQPQVPATIHEAGGNTVGGVQDFNANHHGEMHELA